MKRLICALLLSSATSFAATPGLIKDSSISPSAAIQTSKLKALATSSVVFTGTDGKLVAGQLIGDFTNSGSTATISPAVVTNAKMAVMNNSTLKCNISGGSASPTDCTNGQATALISAFIGDGVSTAGTKGAVPAPAAGDAGLGKVLFANGAWSVPLIPLTPSATSGAVIYSTGTAWAASTIAVPACTAMAANDIDWSLGNCFTKTLSANTVFTMSKRTAGQTIIVRITNPSTYTLTWPNTATQGNSVLWTSSTIPTQSVTNKRDIMTVFFDGTDMYGNPTQGF